MNLLYFMAQAYQSGAASVQSLVTSPSPVVSGVPNLGPVSSLDFTWLFIKMAFAMILVIGLAVVLIRWVIPRLATARLKGARTDLQILDRVPLDARKSLYVLQIEGRKFLISASEQHTGLIAEL